MTKVIRLRKGLNINIEGVAKETTSSINNGSSVYALIPADYAGLTPKLMVKEGDNVMAGDALFYNKASQDVKFVSPVSGKVSLIERGERRKVLSVRVEADTKQQYKDFGKTNIESLSNDKALALLLESGLFAFMRQRPYDTVCNPEDKPKAIFVSTFSSMPLAANFTYVVKGQEADFQLGISLLSKIAKVYVGISKAQQGSALESVKDAEVTIYDGPNPAGNVGVQIANTLPINKGEVVWTIGAEEVIFVGRLARTGNVNLERTIAVAGADINNACYVKALVGTQIGNIVNGNLKSGHNVRIINGNPLVGTKTTTEGFLGAHTTEITAIPEGDDVHEMFGWMMPRTKQFSTSRSYLSWLFGKNKSYNLDARIKGGERHIIMSGEYDKVMPMDIYAGFLVKAIITGDIDKMEQLGIYEVAPEDFAVAEFVDSSKLELQRIVREGLDMLRKEME